MMPFYSVFREREREREEEKRQLKAGAYLRNESLARLMSALSFLEYLCGHLLLSFERHVLETREALAIA